MKQCERTHSFIKIGYEARYLWFVSLAYSFAIVKDAYIQHFWLKHSLLTIEKNSEKKIRKAITELLMTDDHAFENTSGFSKQW